MISFLWRVKEKKPKKFLWQTITQSIKWKMKIEVEVLVSKILELQKYQPQKKKPYQAEKKILVIWFNIQGKIGWIKVENFKWKKWTQIATMKKKGLFPLILITQFWWFPQPAPSETIVKALEATPNSTTILERKVQCSSFPTKAQEIILWTLNDDAGALSSINKIKFNNFQNGVLKTSTRAGSQGV